MLTLCAPCADSFHKPGFKMHTKILHHLFRIVSEDAIKAPLWDTAALGPTAFPNNAAYVHQQVSQLLTTSFSNLRPQQVEVSSQAQSQAYCLGDTCACGQREKQRYTLKSYGRIWVVSALSKTKKATLLKHWLIMHHVQQDHKCMLSSVTCYLAAAIGVKTPAAQVGPFMSI